MIGQVKRRNFHWPNLHKKSIEKNSYNGLQYTEYKRICKSTAVLKKIKKAKGKKKKATWREGALLYRKMLANASRRSTCRIK